MALMCYVNIWGMGLTVKFTQLTWKTDTFLECCQKCFATLKHEMTKMSYFVKFLHSSFIRIQKMAGLAKGDRAAVRPRILRFNNILRYWLIWPPWNPAFLCDITLVRLICLLLIISSGNQTLGEEYVHIIQVDPTERRVPSRARRGLFVFCHVFFPYLLDKVLVCLENELEGGQESRGGVCRRQAAPRVWSLESWLRRGAQKAVALLSESQRKACLPAVFALQQGLTLLHRLHVAVFYLSGSFYHLSKRAAGISYVGDTLYASDITWIDVKHVSKCGCYTSNMIYPLKLFSFDKFGIILVLY